MWPPRSLVITDRSRLDATDEDDAALVAFAVAVAAAGVDAVQLRERDWPDARLLRVTRAACDALRGTRCRVLVNERAHVAWAAGAHGVHLRSGGMPASRVRAVQPGPFVIGRSVHVDDDPAVAAATDYVLFGSVFRSGSKGADAAAAGLPALAAWTGAPGMVPVVAVGGIDLERCEAVRAAGACGIAGIDLFATAYAHGAAALAATVRDIHAVFRDGERSE